MNKSSKQLPEQLRGKVIVVSGTLPGAGKSYVRKYWARVLRRDHYQVFNLGTTNKVSDDATVTKKFGTFVKDAKTFTYKTPCTKNGGSHRTRAFVLIDEAFMLQKGHLIDLVKYYPECCFILFGDPLQFDPVTTYVLEGDNEELLLQQMSYDEAVGIMVDKADVVLDIQGSHRYDMNSDLFKVVQELRRGVIDTKVLWDFIAERVVPEIDFSEPNITIPFTKAKCEEINFLAASTPHKLYRAVKTRFDGTEKKWSKGDLFEKVVGIAGEEYFRNIETMIVIDLPDEGGLFDKGSTNCNFELSNAVNAHKVQGATIGNQTIYVPLFDICQYVNEDKDKTWIWLQKYLYVVLSRAKSGDQIKFLVDQDVNGVYHTLNRCLDIGFDPMRNELLDDAIKINDSSDLIMEDVVSYLQTLVSPVSCYKDDETFEQVRNVNKGKPRKSKVDLSYVVGELHKAGYVKTSKGIQKYLMENHILSTRIYQKYKEEILRKL